MKDIEWNKKREGEKRKDFLKNIPGVFLFLAMLMFTSVTAGSTIDRSTSYKGFPWGYCTWYAAKEFDKVAPSPGIGCDKWRGRDGRGGHAQEWYQRAQRAGWVVTRDPARAIPGSIIVWRGGGFGHVAIVREVTSTHVHISEMNSGTIIRPGITNNFGVVTTARLLLTNLNRGSSLTFRGFILPERAQVVSPPPRAHPQPSLNLTTLSPTRINTASAPHNATLTVTGTNFNNITDITFTWSGAVSGSRTWFRGDHRWNAGVVIHSNTSMTLMPRVVEPGARWSGTVNWSTLRDNQGRTATRSFVVNYNP